MNVFLFKMNKFLNCFILQKIEFKTIKNFNTSTKLFKIVIKIKNY